LRSTDHGREVTSGATEFLKVQLDRHFRPREVVGLDDSLRYLVVGVSASNRLLNERLDLLDGVGGVQLITALHYLEDGGSEGRIDGSIS
jgi:hypothetical protein